MVVTRVTVALLSLRAADDGEAAVVRVRDGCVFFDGSQAGGGRGVSCAGAGNRPSHRTISDFRLRHLSEFSGMFVEVVELARRWVWPSWAGCRSTAKVRASASKRKAMSYSRMPEEPRLEAEIEELLRKASEVDAAEDALYGEDKRGDELPEELHAGNRLAAIRAAKPWRRSSAQPTLGASPGRIGIRKEVGLRGYGEPEESAQSFTDPESGIMKTAEGSGRRWRWTRHQLISGGRQRQRPGPDAAAA